MMRTMTVLVASLLAVTCVQGQAVEAMRELGGNLGIHDPSIIAFDDGRHVSFATGVERAPDGGAIRLKTSPDGIIWEEAGTLGTGQPGWVEETLGVSPPNLWAPSVSQQNDGIYVYYAASSFGRNRSAIGLTVNAGFDPDNPGEGWEDRGVVFESHPSDNFNAIDPVRFDDDDGRSWLAFGSWWDGIKMIELDPHTGKRIAPDSEIISLASRGGGAIEAPAILKHGDWYYLFVSFDHCCRGVASDYNIRVGRSESVTGPYLDAEGAPMLEGGGTLVMETEGKYRGPGGQETFIAPDGTPMLAFHFYHRDLNGFPNVQIEPIMFTDDGWPHIAQPETD